VQGVLPWCAFKSRCPQGRVFAAQQLPLGVTLLHAQPFAVVAQQGLHCVRTPVGGQHLQALQRLRVMRQTCAQIADGVLRVPFEFGLDLAGFVASCQPHQGDQCGQHQRDQGQPQRHPSCAPGQQVVQGSFPLSESPLPALTLCSDWQLHGFLAGAVPGSTRVTRGSAQLPSMVNS